MTRALPALLLVAVVGCAGPVIPSDDRDGDGLINRCEEKIFLTDPDSRDSDGDRVEDGDEDHDGNDITNIIQQEDTLNYETYRGRCFVDTDQDGLADSCERDIFGTDPLNPDTDEDGQEDSYEDHDGDRLQNVFEQSNYVFDQDSCHRG